MADERRYLDYNGLAYFWGRLKQAFQYYLNQTTSDVIYKDKDNIGDAHISLQAVSDDGSTKTRTCRILPSGSTCLGTPQDKYLVTAAAAKCIAQRYASNQNAFSNIKVGSTTVAADSPTDTVTLVGSGDISITPNASNDTITIGNTPLTFNSPLVKCSSTIKLKANTPTSIICSIIGSCTPNLTCNSTAGQNVRGSNTTIPTTAAVQALINKATEGIASDAVVATKIQDVRYNCKKLQYSKNGTSYTDITTATNIVNDGLSLSYNVPAQKLTVNNKCLVIGPKEYSGCSSNNGTQGLNFTISNSSWKLTSSTPTNVCYVAPTWNAMQNCLNSVRCAVAAVRPGLLVTESSTSTNEAANDSANPYLSLLTNCNTILSSSQRFTGSGATSVKYNNGEIVIHSVNCNTKCTTRVTQAANSKLYLVGSTSNTTGVYSTNTGSSSVYTQSGYLYSTTPSSGDNSTKVATTSYVDSAVATASSGAIHFCGVWPADSTVTTKTDYKNGTYWLVDAERAATNALCVVLETGDMVYHVSTCKTFRKSDFTIVQSNLSRITCAVIDSIIAT